LSLCLRRDNAKQRGHMPDVFSAATRSCIMSRVRGQDTQPERIVRATLHRLGFRFRLHDRSLPGLPDVVLKKYRTVVFIHGCFWHGHKGCKRSKRPSTNVRFWNKKIDGNMVRDRRVKRQLWRRGWRVLTVWQCQARDIDKLERLLVRFFEE